MGWELCKAVRCSEQSAKSVQLRVHVGPSVLLFYLGKLSQSCKSKEGKETSSLACGISVLSAALAALHSHRNPLQYNHPSHQLPSSHGQ